MTAKTNAATVKVTVGSSLLESDPLLTFLLTLVPPHQMDLQVTADGSSSSKKDKGKGGGKGKGKGKGNKKGGGGGGESKSGGGGGGNTASSLKLSMECNGGETVLTQRNAILRSLCGMSLHNGMDNASTGPYLLGGYSAMSAASRSLEASMVLSNTASWMSVAESLRDGTADVGATGKHLDGVLLQSAFLCGPSVPQPTLADFDVFFALATALAKQQPPSDEDEEEAPSALTHANPNLQRWINQCAATVQRLLEAVNRVPSQKDLPNVSLSDTVQQQLGVVVDPLPEPAPTFVYASGTTDSSVGTNPSSPSRQTQTPTNVPPTDPSSSSSTPPPPSSSSSSSSSPPSAADAALEEKKKKAAEKKAAKKAAKDAKKAANKANNGPQATAKSTPAPDYNISALDIRVGKILTVSAHESSDKLWIESVDVGEDQPRQILSGLRGHFTLEQMEKQGYVLVLCNLKARKLGGIPSHGMVLCASSADKSEVQFVVPTGGEGSIKVGERVVFESYEEGEPEAESKIAKKKIFEKLAPDLKTDEGGNVVWNGKKAKTSAGGCVAAGGMKGGMVA